MNSIVVVHRILNTGSFKTVQTVQKWVISRFHRVRIGVVNAMIYCRAYGEYPLSILGELFLKRFLSSAEIPEGLICMRMFSLRFYRLFVRRRSLAATLSFSLKLSGQFNPLGYTHWVILNQLCPPSEHCP